MGTTTPSILQNVFFFYLGLHFVLCAVQEQHDLLVEQLERVPGNMYVNSEIVYYKYVEYISKNNQHRFKDAKVHNKVGKFMANHILSSVW